MNKKSFGERINTWLEEPEGQIFSRGKWRFWFPSLIGLTTLNAIMTAVIFGQDGAQKYIGSIVILAGAVLCWLAVGLLHYSDSGDSKLARGVAILDSVALLFVAAHFSFLLWAQGHLWILRGAEDQYRVDMATYNAQWQPVKESNEQIAATVERIAGIEKETERLRNDTAYWSRRNKTQPSKSGIKFNASLTPVEVSPPPKSPSESSADFLAGWDVWIRLTSFGELALALATLIFIRVRSSLTNSPRKEEFPDEIDVEDRLSTPHERLETAPIKSQRKKKLARIIDSFDSARYAAGVKALRDALRDISFRLKGRSFKVTVKPNCIWIMMVEANHGTQETVSSAKAKLSLLDDAVNMPREAFRGRLEKFLRQNSFEI